MVAAVPSLVLALRAYPRLPGVLQPACEALQALSLVREHRAAVAAADAIPALVAVATANAARKEGTEGEDGADEGMEAKEVRRRVCGALEGLASAEDEGTATAAAAGLRDARRLLGDARQVGTDASATCRRAHAGLGVAEVGEHMLLPP